MKTDKGSVLPQHQVAAAIWGEGGNSYDNISFAISDALAHAAQRLNAMPGEHILDIATGTGWTARNVARYGAHVTGVDISSPLLEAAVSLASHLQPPIEFLLADAERLPYADKKFDGVISTFGVMFATDQEQAAREMARVCKPGGRLALATWAPDGAVARFFAVIGKHSPAPPPPASPLAWGDPARVSELLGRDFELKFESGISHAYHDSTQAIWDWYAKGFGPVRHLFAALDKDQAQAFRKDVDDYHRHYETDLGLLVSREYLITVGKRKQAS